MAEKGDGRKKRAASQEQSPAKSAQTAASTDPDARQARARSQRLHLRQLRIQQAAQREKEENRRRRRGIPAWGIMLIAVAAVLLLMMLLFRVHDYEVSGNVRYSAQEVYDASGITEGNTLIGLSKAEAASRILTKLPYVEEVTVTRVLPSLVKFDVKECRAVVAVSSEFGSTWLLSENGKILERQDETENLPIIRGIVLNLPAAGDSADFSDETKGKIGLRIAAAAEECGLAAFIRTIDVSDLNDILLNYDGRLEIWLGDSTDLSYKMQYLAAALEELNENSRGALDLTFSSGTHAVFHPIS